MLSVSGWLGQRFLSHQGPITSSHVLDGWVVQDFLLLGGHRGTPLCLFRHLIAIAVFIVRPGNEFYKVVTEINVSPSIKDGRVGVTVNVAGDNLVPSVTQDGPLEGSPVPASTPS
jgi:hypothetical protein